MKKNANNLIQSVRRVLGKSENRIPAIKGVRGLSRSDCETAILYAQTIIRCGTWEGELMRPRGEVSELMSAFGLPV